MLLNLSGFNKSLSLLWLNYYLRSSSFHAIFRWRFGATATARSIRIMSLGSQRKTFFPGISVIRIVDFPVGPSISPNGTAYIRLYTHRPPTHQPTNSHPSKLSHIPILHFLSNSNDTELPKETFKIKHWPT